MCLFADGFTPIVEISQSGTGCHVWLCFDEPVPAHHVYAFWKEFKRRNELPSGTEQYPRQASLRGLEYGNLIRYPLFNESKFALFEPCAENSTNVVWHEQNPLAVLTDGRVTRTTHTELTRVLEWWGIAVDEPDEQSDVLTTDDITPRVRSLLIDNHAGLLGRRWAGDVTGLFDPSRSALIQSIATELVRAYVPTPDIESALRYWSERHDYEKGQRQDFIHRTVLKAYDFAVDRRERKSLTGDTVPALAHQYVDAVFNHEYKLIPYGINAIDESIGGMANQELIVISGRPNHGKSALCLQILENAAANNDPTLMISLEMSPQSYSNRVLLRLGEENRDGNWYDASINQRLHRKIDEHYSSRAPMYFVDGFRSIDRIESVIEQYVRDRGVKLVAVDYQGLADAGERDEYRNQSEITKRLKNTGKQFDIPIITVVMMNRASEKEPNRLPRMSDLQGSGVIEATADIVLFGVWPHKNDPNLDKRHYTCVCAKNRNRATHKAVMSFQYDPTKQTFT